MSIESLIVVPGRMERSIEELKVGSAPEEPMRGETVTSGLGLVRLVIFLWD